MAEAATILEWILELIKTTLHAGESINIQSFGKLPSAINTHALDGIRERANR